MIRVALIDDHAMVRAGFRMLLEKEPGIEVVGEAEDGEQGLALLRRLRPDVALLDLHMPGLTGIEVTERVRRADLPTRLIILTVAGEAPFPRRLLEAGASGYLLKNSTRASLIPALRAVAAGQRWIPQEVASRLAARKLFEELTPRELDVLQLLAKGRANKEIADVLNISEYTVKGYLKNILGKLHVADRTEAVTAALQRGIIHL